MRFPVILAAMLLAPSSALAQEAIATAGAGSPPAAEAAPGPSPARTADPNSPEAIGRWARGVLAGAPSEEAKAETKAGRGCMPPADHKPHGQVWAGVGTGGYRNIGGVVTQPIGDCGQVTIAIDKVEMDAPRRR